MDNTVCPLYYNVNRVHLFHLQTFCASSSSSPPSSSSLLLQAEVAVAFVPRVIEFACNVARVR